MTDIHKARIKLKNNVWYFIGTKYSGSCADLYVLLMAARAAGEIA